MIEKIIEIIVLIGIIVAVILVYIIADKREKRMEYDEFCFRKALIKKLGEICRAIKENNKEN